VERRTGRSLPKFTGAAFGIQWRCVWNIPVENFVLTKGAGLIVPVVFWVSF